MAFLRSSSPAEVGLQLLLSPLGSNVVVRTACCSVGVVLPVYSTFKAIESKDPTEQNKWLVYWAAYGSFTLAEMITDKLVHWFPLYYQMKFAFLVWLQLPSADGASQLYMNYLRPFLLRHQARLDFLVGLLYGEMDKFAVTHKAEFQFAKKILTSILMAAHQVMWEIIYPVHRDIDRSIEGPTGPTEIEEDSSSDLED